MSGMQKHRTDTHHILLTHTHTVRQRRKFNHFCLFWMPWHFEIMLHCVKYCKLNRPRASPSIHMWSHPLRMLNMTTKESSHSILGFGTKIDMNNGKKSLKLNKSYQRPTWRSIALTSLQKKKRLIKCTNIRLWTDNHKIQRCNEKMIQHSLYRQRTELPPLLSLGGLLEALSWLAACLRASLAEFGRRVRRMLQGLDTPPRLRLPPPKISCRGGNDITSQKT